jgi:hypothetical protein
VELEQLELAAATNVATALSSKKLLSAAAASSKRYAEAMAILPENPVASTFAEAEKVGNVSVAGDANYDAATAVVNALQNRAAAVKQLKKAQGLGVAPAQNAKDFADNACTAAFNTALSAALEVVDQAQNAVDIAAAAVPPGVPPPPIPPPPPNAPPPPAVPGAPLPQPLAAAANPIALQSPQWSCKVLQPYSCCTGGFIENDFDSGIAIACSMYMMANDCPVYLQLNDLAQFRLNFSYWILSQNLPH